MSAAAGEDEVGDDGEFSGTAGIVLPSDLLGFENEADGEDLELFGFLGDTRLVSDS